MRGSALPFVVLIALVLAGWWTYAPALDSYLITDDVQWLASAMEFSPARLVQISGRTHFYRPVVELYFAAMYTLSGCDPRTLHAGSVMLHVLNAALAGVLAYAVTARVAFAAISALLFVVQPAAAQAVLWPAAVSSLLSATFGLAMLRIDLGRSLTRAQAPDALATTAIRSVAVPLLFAAALGSHESAVMWLPACLLLRYGAGERNSLIRWAREYGACLVVLTGYLAVTVLINSRNYVVTEGVYTLGWHMAVNLAHYLVALWVGRRVALDYTITGLAVAALMWKGSLHIRIWTLWVVAALAPMLLFVGSTSSRYAYAATVPFCWLLAAGILAVHEAVLRATDARGRRGVAAAVAVLVLLTGFVVIRSATFARKGAVGFRTDAAAFERVAEALRAQPGTALTVRASAVAWMDEQYLLPLARVARCDPGVSVDTID
jgi:hypothetical protein